MTQQSVIDQVKSWASPVLLAAVIAMAGYIWLRSEDRDNRNDAVVARVAEQLSGVASSVAVMQETQRNSAESRLEFQGSMTTAVNKLDDAVMGLSESVAALTAIQQRQEQVLGRDQ